MAPGRGLDRVAAALPAPWRRARLRVTWWDGPEPEAGDELETRTGRRYLIVRVLARSLDCLVVPRDAPAAAGRVFRWEWTRRR